MRSNMPKKPPRNNPRNRALRTVQGAPSILRRIMQRQGLDIPFDNQLSESFVARLPGALRNHVVEVVKKGEELVILTDTAAWAARLKLVLAADPDLAAGRRTSVKVAPRGATGR
jgi:hypothetical protein